MAKSVHLKNAAILTATGLLLRAAGMIFRVYIAAEIGAAGIGLYQLVFTVYNLAVTLATAGLSAVTTRTVAALENKQSARHAMRVLLALSLFTGLCAAFGLFFAAYPAAQYWLGDAHAAPALQILAPSLPFMAVSAVIRGYYMAVRNVKPNAIAQIGEQAVRIGAVALLLAKIGTDDMVTACCAVVAGNIISEALSWIYMTLCYKREMKGVKPQKSQNEHLLKNTLLRLLPDVTQAWIKHDEKALHGLLSRILSITLAASIPSAALFWLFAYDIGHVLYKSTEVGFFLCVLAPMTPIMYLESMVDGILKGIDKQSATFRYTVIDCIARIILIWLFVPKYGMEGFLIIMLASNMFTGLLNLRCLLSTARMRINVRQWLLKPILLSVATVGAVWLLFIRSSYAATSLLVRTCTAGVAFVCIYLLLMLVFSPTMTYNKRKK